MKVYIVEDSCVVFESLQLMLSGIPGVVIAGRAVEEEVAIEDIGKLLPDVVILDLHLSVGSGLAVLEVIKKSHPEVKVVVLSNYATEAYMSRCTELGADHFFDKSYQFMMVKVILDQMMFNKKMVGVFGDKRQH